MEGREFHVELITRVRTVYAIRSGDVEGARRIALRRWSRGEASDMSSLEGADLARVRVIESGASSLDGADEAVLLRYLDDHEHFLGREAGDVWLSDGANDAISASQAALDLRWVIPESGDPPLVDTLRATLALERLSSAGRLVRFTRPMARAGERGEIHLYCTPEYLERMSESVPVPDVTRGRDASG